jgi:two-component system response regulator MtrA
MDGTAALEVLETIKPDLVILDVMMPGIDGIELCSRIRSDPQTVQTPIIFLSARGDTETIQMALASGGDEYLVKPLLPQDLVDKVFVLLGQPA